MRLCLQALIVTACILVMPLTQAPAAVTSQEPDLFYRLSISSNDATSGLAHVTMTSPAFSSLSSIKLVMHGTTAGWYDPIEVRDFSAFGDGQDVTVQYRIDDNKRQTWTILHSFAKNLTVEYDVYLRYFDKNTGGEGAYMGYLGSKFLLSWAGWVFLLPSSYSGEVSVVFQVPDTWSVAVPWQMKGNRYVAPADENFAKSTIGIGPFETRTSTVGTTELTVAVHRSWSQNDREKTFEYTSAAYRYLVDLFGAPGPQRYLAVYVPQTEDNHRVDFIESYDSQGEALGGFGMNLMYGFVHRVFHTFNAFPPSGMGSRSGAEQWFSEGCDVYYDSKIPFILKYQADLNYMKDYLSEYDSNYGTPQDAPVSSAGDYFNPQDFDRALFLAYSKGSLVNFLLDSTIQRFSSGAGSLDDVLREMYRLYGNKKGFYSNTNIKSIASRAAQQDLSKFFDLYVYGTQRLPIQHARPLGIVVDWQQVETDLGPLPQQSVTSTTLITSLSTSMVFQIDGLESDWTISNLIIEDPSGDSKKGTADTDLKAVYAAADEKNLYVMIQVWGKPDPGNNYIFPVDLNGDADWDYSFGFNEHSAWMYDLRGVPNGQWTNEVTLDATYAIGNVAEIALPLAIMGHPESIDMLVWIYYPSLGITLDETGWGSVPFIAITTTTTSLTTASSVSSSAASTILASTSAVTTSGTTEPTLSMPYTVGAIVLSIVVVGIAIFLMRNARKAKS